MSKLTVIALLGCFALAVCDDCDDKVAQVEDCLQRGYVAERLTDCLVYEVSSKLGKKATRKCRKAETVVVDYCDTTSCEEEEDDGCTAGYKLKEGDIPGWGSYLGSFSSSSRDECADRCSENLACKSFEHSFTELKCNLNTGTYPTQGKYRDYAFCSKTSEIVTQVCPDGYTLKEGDIPGWGSYLGSFYSATRQDCADSCDDQEACKSFEHSHSSNKCNLNTGANPTQGKYRGIFNKY